MAKNGVQQWCWILCLLVFLFSYTQCLSTRDKKPQLPCPIVNNVTKTVMCCSPTNKECVTLTPKESLGNMSGVWTVKEFKNFKRSWEPKVSMLMKSNEKVETCCCKENSNLILPNKVASKTGELTSVVQGIGGYVQPVFANLCNSATCIVNDHGASGMFSCTQEWTKRSLFVNDRQHKGFMLLREVKIPNGCTCKLREKEHFSIDIQDYAETKLPESITTKSTPVEVIHNNGNDDSTLHRVKRGEVPPSGKRQDQYNLVDKKIFDDPMFYEQLSEVLPVDNQYDDEIINPALYHSPNEMPLNIDKYNNNEITENLHDKPDVPYNLNSEYNQNGSPPYGTHYLNDFSSDYLKESNYSHGPLYSDNTDFYSYENNNNSYLYDYSDNPDFDYYQKNNYSYGNDYLENANSDYYQNYNHSYDTDYIDNTNIEYQNKNHSYLTDYYDKIYDKFTHDLANFGDPQQLEHMQTGPLKSLKNLISVINSSNPELLDALNMLLSNTFKIGLLQKGFGKMTTSEIMKTILMYVPKSKQIEMLEIFRSLMEEKTKISEIELKKLELILKYSKELGSSMGFIPKQLQKNDHSSMMDFPTNFKNGASVTMTPSNDNPFPVNIDILDKLIQSPENPNSILIPVGSTLVNTQLLAPETDEVAISIPEPPPTNLPKQMRMEDMLESELNFAFSSFLFHTAWKNTSCMVPTNIQRSLSEFHFLPDFIKDRFNIKGKGLLNIHKYAGRIIDGIVRCQFRDPESALLDGRLAKAIAGGIKTAQLLDSFITIMKEMMIGFLDTRDAENIANILKWAVNPSDDETLSKFLNSGDIADIRSSLQTLDISLDKYRKFVKSLRSLDRNSEETTESSDKLEQDDISTPMDTLKITSLEDFSFQTRVDDTSIISSLDESSDSNPSMEDRSTVMSFVTSDSSPLTTIDMATTIIEATTPVDTNLGIMIDPPIVTPSPPLDEVTLVKKNKTSTNMPFVTMNSMPPAMMDESSTFTPFVTSDNILLTSVEDMSNTMQLINASDSSPTTLETKSLVTQSFTSDSGSNTMADDNFASTPFIPSDSSFHTMEDDNFTSTPFIPSDSSAHTTIDEDSTIMTLVASNLISLTSMDNASTPMDNASTDTVMSLITSDSPMATTIDDLSTIADAQSNLETTPNPVQLDEAITANIISSTIGDVEMSADSLIMNVTTNLDIASTENDSNVTYEYMSTLFSITHTDYSTEETYPGMISDTSGVTGNMDTNYTTEMTENMTSHEFTTSTYIIKDTTDAYNVTMLGDDTEEFTIDPITTQHSPNSTNDLTSSGDSGNDYIEYDTYIYYDYGIDIDSSLSEIGNTSEETNIPEYEVIVYEYNDYGYNDTNYNDENIDDNVVDPEVDYTDYYFYEYNYYDYDESESLSSSKEITTDVNTEKSITESGGITLEEGNESEIKSTTIDVGITILEEESSMDVNEIEAAQGSLAAFISDFSGNGNAVKFPKDLPEEYNPITLPMGSFKRLLSSL